jgi:YbbR domain-containing protein
MDLIRRNFGLKVTSVVIAVALWFTFNYLSASQDVYTKTLDLNVSVRGVASGLIATTAVDRATVELSGIRADVDAVKSTDLDAFVDCSGKSAGAYSLNIAVVGRDADKVKAVDPPQAVVSIDRFAFRTVPVVARDATGGELANAVLAPSSIQVTGAQTAVAQVVAAEVSVPEPRSLPMGFAADMKPVPVDEHMQPVTGASALGVVSITGPPKQEPR